MRRLSALLLGFLALAIGLPAHAQCNPVYNTTSFLPACKGLQQLPIIVPSGQSIELKSGASLTCDAGATCNTGGAAGPYLPLSGGTMTGSLTFADGSVWSSTGVALTAGKNITSPSGSGIEVGDEFAINWNASGQFTTVALGSYGFSSNTIVTGVNDTAISRTAAGTLAIGNGTQGDTSGTIALRFLRFGTDTGLSNPSNNVIGIDGATPGDGLGSLAVHNITINATGTAPTQSPGDNSTKLATTAFVQSALGQTAKAFGKFSVSGSACTLTQGFNVGACTYNSAGDYTVAFTTAFADANYTCTATYGANSFGLTSAILSQATGNISIGIGNTVTQGGQDPNSFYFSCFGQ